MTAPSKKRVADLYGALACLATARKHLRMMALLMCLALVSGLVLYIYLPTVYYSRSVVRVTQLVSPSDTKKADNNGQLRLLVNELTQPHILERTALRLGVRTTHNELRKKYLFKIAVRPNTEQNLEIEVWPYSKEWAKNWTETLVQEYLDFQREKRLKKEGDTTEAWAKEITEVSGKLDSNGVKAEISEKDGKISAPIELDRLPRELARLNKRIDEMARVRINLQDPKLHVAEKISLVASVAGGAGAESFVPRPSTSATGIPVKEIESTDQRLEFELQSALKQFDVEYQELLDRKAVFEARLPEYNEIRRNNPKLGQEERVKAAILGKMAAPVEVLDSEREKEGVELTYVGLQQLSERPVSPNCSKLLLFSLLFGGILAVGVPLVIQYFDHTVSDLERMEAAFQLRGLGIVPEIEREAARHLALIDGNENNQSFLTENLRVICANLLSMGSITKAPHVTLVTSALPKEGKTVVSANLAIAFAETGTRTLLIDSDLRRGRMHRLFGYRKAPGLSDVLLDEVLVEEAIRSTTRENLFVLPTGRRLDTGAELLGSDKFAQLLARLRERYARIVVDAPPVLGLSETSVIQRHLDGVLFVIWSGHTPLRTINAAIESLRGDGANFYGFVLNRRDMKLAPNSSNVAGHPTITSARNLLRC